MTQKFKTWNVLILIFFEKWQFRKQDTIRCVEEIFSVMNFSVRISKSWKLNLYKFQKKNEKKTIFFDFSTNSVVSRQTKNYSIAPIHLFSCYLRRSENKTPTIRMLNSDWFRNGSALVCSWFFAQICSLFFTYKLGVLQPPRANQSTLGFVRVRWSVKKGTPQSLSVMKNLQKSFLNKWGVG